MAQNCGYSSTNPFAAAMQEYLNSDDDFVRPAPQKQMPPQQQYPPQQQHQYNQPHQHQSYQPQQQQAPPQQQGYRPVGGQQVLPPRPQQPGQPLPLRPPASSTSGPNPTVPPRDRAPSAPLPPPQQQQGYSGQQPAPPQQQYEHPAPPTNLYQQPLPPQHQQSYQQQPQQYQQPPPAQQRPAHQYQQAPPPQQPQQQQHQQPPPHQAYQPPLQQQQYTSPPIAPRREPAPSSQGFQYPATVVPAQVVSQAQAFTPPTSYITPQSSQAPSNYVISSGADLDRFATYIPPEHASSLQTVVNYLTTHAPRALSPMEKARVVYAWICQCFTIDLKLSAEVLFAHYSTDNLLTSAATLSSRASNAIGFANLFFDAMNILGIEASIIPGRSRLMRFSNSGGDATTCHTWNAVSFNGQWFLVDCTFGIMNPSLGDGMPLNPNSFNYNPNYFMMPPELFILNHFPKEKGWQLLESPMSREQWINYPNFGPSMFADQSNRFFGPVVSQYIVNQRYRINLIYSGDIMWQVGQQSPKVTKLQPRGPAYYDEDVVAGSTDCYLTTVDYARHQSLLLTTPRPKYFGIDVYGPPEGVTVASGGGSQSILNTMDSVARAAPSYATNSIKDLAKYFDGHGKNQIEKARLIFVWIANNVSYDWKTYQKNGGSTAGNEDTIRQQSAESVFRYKTGVCAGYANLFKGLCEEVGIECFVITGIGAGGPGLRGAHAWNAAILAGKLYLFDVCWAAGHVNPNEGKFTFKYNESYWATAPHKLLDNHYPTDPAWQLIDQPITLTEFDARPKVNTPVPGVGVMQGYRNVENMSNDLNTGLNNTTKKIGNTWNKIFR